MQCPFPLSLRAAMHNDVLLTPIALSTATVLLTPIALSIPTVLSAT
eukprot:COSAG01_NODE_16868_length_1197_cov_12.926230_1_plen_45_part_10